MVEEVFKVLEIGKVVVVDEVYVEFVGKDFFGFLDEYFNFVFLRIFLKVFSLVGVRVGYVFVSEEIIEVFYWIKLFFSVDIFV